MKSKDKKEYSIEIPSDTAYLDKVDKLCTEVVKYSGLGESEGDDVAIAVTELVNNSIHHGNKNNKSKKVNILFIVNNNQIEVRIKDQGTGFNPKKINNPLDPDNIMKESGRGIFLIKELMDSIDFKFSENGTEIITTKKINK